MHKKVDYLIIGAGISGLAFASGLENESYLICEKESDIGGYCRTVKRGDYTWDFAGHFFHFQRPEIQSEFSSFLQSINIVHSVKNTKIYYKGQYIDYPFQFNIHQLEKPEFIDCLYGLFTKDASKEAKNFKEMLYSKFGEAISDKFLIPYNEKLYACDLNRLDINAMGRFFPNANPSQIIRGFKEEKIKTYNDEFFYSKDGAFAFVQALAKKVDPERILRSTEITRIDYKRKVAYMGEDSIEYEILINTMPFDKFLCVSEIAHEDIYTSNKVLVFNIGFDKPSLDSSIHWIYFPGKETLFYRVGFYNNILRQNKLSIYVEIGLNNAQKFDLEEYQSRTLKDLKSVGIISDHQLVDIDAIIMDPAYVHITESAKREKEEIKKELAKYGIYSIGRYGNWTYCSIEDCISEAYMLCDACKGKYNGRKTEKTI